MRGCNSLPVLPAQRPIPLEAISNSLPFSGPAGTTRNIRRQAPIAGPVLHMTVAGTSFHEGGSYFLTLTSSRSRLRTQLLDGRSQLLEKEERFTFPLDEETSLDLELSICATRVRAASPRGVRSCLQAAAREAAGGWSSKVSADEPDCPRGWEEVGRLGGAWEDDVGIATLRLSQLLSSPQPAGSTKVYDVELFSPHEARTPVGTVHLRWSMEDRAAEASEAAARAADLHRKRWRPQVRARPRALAATGKRWRPRAQYTRSQLRTTFPPLPLSTFFVGARGCRSAWAPLARRGAATLTAAAPP